jgi:phage terminase large subunit-like protein
MKQVERDLESKMIIYNNKPLDKWCLANTAKEEDKNGNIQPCKTSKATKRIDGAAALLDACVILQEKLADYQSMI